MENISQDTYIGDWNQKWGQPIYPPWNPQPYNYHPAPSIYITPDTTVPFVVEEDIFEEFDSAVQITRICDDLKEFLLEKNRKYGDSALNPSRIFSSSDAVEQIKVRIDDKLTRMKNAQSDEDEDVVWDLLGYLVILIAAKERNSEDILS